MSDRRQSLTSTHWGTYAVDIDNGGLLSMKPLDQDPDPSRIGEGLCDALDSSLRIPQPMIRRGWLEQRTGRGRGREPFVPVSWDKAFSLVAEELDNVIARHGNEAIFGGSYGWASAGRFHHAQSQLHRFLNHIGGYTFSVGTYSSAAAEVIVPHVLGHDFREATDAATTWNVIAKHTELIIAFGGMARKNAQVHPGGLSRHLVPSWLRRCKDNGIRFVNVSPIRSDSMQELNADWVSVRPNTDTALMLGIAHTLIAEGLVDYGFVERYCEGYDRFEAYVNGMSDGICKDAGWAASISGVSESAIIQLARLISSRRTLISLSLSVQRADHGEQVYWAAITLAAMLGQIGLPGGGIGFAYGALGSVGNPRLRVKGPTVSQGRNPVKSFIPVARITDMLLSPGAEFDFNGKRYTYPEIRLIYWCGGNPFHHQQDLKRLDSAWKKPETVIAHEIWWNPLARSADIVLPATTVLERNDIGFAAHDQNVIAMKKALDPVNQSLSDFEILSGIAEKLGTRSAFTEDRDEMGWLKHLYEEFSRNARLDTCRCFEAFWEAGMLYLPIEEKSRVYLSEFRNDPVANPLSTPSGRIEVFSERIAGFGYGDCPGHPTWLDPCEWLGSDLSCRYPLHLISNQPPNRLHSQLDNGSVSQDAKVAGREPVAMNLLDARSRGITGGDIVRIYNSRGACLAGVVIDDALRPGVVQIATGAWFDPVYRNGSIELDRSGNPNILTIDKGASRLSQAPVSNTALVEIERYKGKPPDVQIYDPPGHS